jgi:hypothetical protein
VPWALLVLVVLAVTAAVVLRAGRTATFDTPDLIAVDPAP